MANPYRLTGNLSPGKKGRSGCLLALVLIVFIGGGGVAAWFVVGMIGHEHAAIEWLNSCPPALEALGDPIAKNPIGWSCGRASLQGERRDATWSIAVRGSRAVGGDFGFHAEKVEHGWTVTHGWLSVAGKPVDISRCLGVVQTPAGRAPSPAEDSGEEGAAAEEPEGAEAVEEVEDAQEAAADSSPAKKKRPKRR